nr:hypothetical protein BaRGS_022343 [Batillaria attramentaria]
MSSRPLPSNHAFLYGTEYDMNSEHDNGENAVCSVCRIPRASTLMIPGTDTCTPGWTLEYWGYLMTGVPSYTAASEYICVDSSMSVYPGAQADDNGKLLVLTVSQCGVGVQTSQPIATKFAMSLEGHLGENIG